MDCFAEVIVDVNHARLDRVFSYRVPESCVQDVMLGSRVALPFGASNREIEGFVIGLSEQCAYDPSKLKAIRRTLDPYPILLAEQIDLARWMVQEYNCLLVEALRLMIPAQLRGNRVQARSERMAHLLLTGNALEEAKASLMSKAGTCKAPQQLRALELLEIQGDLSTSRLSAELGATFLPQPMLKKGWIALEAREWMRKPYASMPQEEAILPILSKEQKQALVGIEKALKERRGAFILKGVTGSGKTEVYLSAITQALALDRSAITLVPEISLTPQTVERFRNRFGDAVAVLHSRLSSGERYDEWRRIRMGEVKVVVGARSAVFAPLANIGLIVVDEEHESSYQSDKNPRYHAIEVGEWRCREGGGVLLLGTATPSIETWRKAQIGELSILELRERINGMPLPEVQIVDMREELASGNKSMFSSALYQAMKECYFSEKQMILFLNRRGYSTFVNCRSCGYVLSCEHCDVSMTYHKNDNSAHCHYCDAQKNVPSHCPECGEAALKYFGAGTEQVEEQVQKLFPGIRITRMDADTTRGKDGHLKLLTEFKERRSDVLIGTQMIAKGLDFPNVTLVGVVAADAMLHVPDYRSAERTFQLLTQVAGRAGRDKDAGHVIVQTYSPSHPSVQLAAKHDYDSFYDYEIQCRKESEFPPFADFVRFLFTGEEDEAVAKECKTFSAGLRSKIEELIDVGGFNRADLLYQSEHASPLHRLRGIYRHQIVMKFRRSEKSHQMFLALSAYTRLMREQGLYALMEINPQNMS